MQARFLVSDFIFLGVNEFGLRFSFGETRSKLSKEESRALKLESDPSSDSLGRKIGVWGPEDRDPLSAKSKDSLSRSGCVCMNTTRVLIS